MGRYRGLYGGCLKTSHQKFSSRSSVLIATFGLALSANKTIPLVILPLSVFSMVCFRWYNCANLQEFIFHPTTKTTFQKWINGGKDLHNRCPTGRNAIQSIARHINPLRLEKSALQQQSSFHLNAPYTFFPVFFDMPELLSCFQNFNTTPENNYL